MNWDQIQGNWKQASGKVKEEAEKQLVTWERRAGDSWFKPADRKP